MFPQFIRQKSCFSTSLIPLNYIKECRKISTFKKNANEHELKNIWISMQKWKLQYCQWHVVAQTVGVTFSVRFLSAFCFYKTKQRCGSFTTCCSPSVVSCLNSYKSKQMKSTNLRFRFKWLNLFSFVVKVRKTAFIRLGNVIHMTLALTK